MSNAEHRPALDAQPAADLTLQSGTAPDDVTGPDVTGPDVTGPDVTRPDDVTDEPEPAQEGTAFVQVTRRRAPRYRAFVFTGIAVAALVSLGVAIASSPADGYSQRQLFGFLLVSLGMVGAIVGGLVAVLVERRR